VAAEVNKALIERFYAALGRCDGAEATACYASGAHFRDPAFGDLEGNEVGAMWRMLAGHATDLEIELHEHEAGEDSGAAHWIARYTFPTTGRPVVKDVRASFRFAEGLIADHVDDFDLRSWAKQALGPMGAVVAAQPLLRKKARAQLRGQLDEFIAAEKDKASA
jgi:ketosteroid isomerase-like protein